MILIFEQTCSRLQV